MKYLAKIPTCAIVTIALLLSACSERSSGPNGISIDSAIYPVFGIDLSEYSGKVDFGLLKKEAAIDFVFLRATAGKDYKDKKFEEYYKDALDNDYLVGYYHYYRFNEDPLMQADFFLEQIGDKKQCLPIVIDVEEYGNKLGGKSAPKITAEINQFIKHLELNTKTGILVYTNVSGYKTFVDEEIRKHPIWICSFKRNSKIDGNWLFWQYSHKGKFKAIEGWVDFNTFNGSRVDWNQFLLEKN